MYNSLNDYAIALLFKVNSLIFPFQRFLRVVLYSNHKLQNFNQVVFNILVECRRREGGGREGGGAAAAGFEERVSIIGGTGPAELFDSNAGSRLSLACRYK